MRFLANCSARFREKMLLMIELQLVLVVEEHRRWGIRRCVRKCLSSDQAKRSSQVRCCRTSERQRLCMPGTIPSRTTLPPIRSTELFPGVRSTTPLPCGSRRAGFSTNKQFVGVVQVDVDYALAVSDLIDCDSVWDCSQPAPTTLSQRPQWRRQCGGQGQ